MPGSKQAAPPRMGRPLAKDDIARDHVGRQLRAAFDPVPTGKDDFADLLRELEKAEHAPAAVAAE